MDLKPTKCGHCGTPWKLLSVETAYDANENNSIVSCMAAHCCDGIGILAQWEGDIVMAFDTESQMWGQVMIFDEEEPVPQRPPVEFSSKRVNYGV